MEATQSSYWKILKGKQGTASPPDSLAEAGQAVRWGQAPPEEVLPPSPCASEHNQERNCGTKDGERISWAWSWAESHDPRQGQGKRLEGPVAGMRR